MKKIILLIIVLGFLSSGFSQDETSIKVVKLTDNLYKIAFYAGYDVNMIASIGEDGLLLVDTGFKSTAKKLKEELKKLGNSEPKYIISTHEHVDHVGGNSIFGKNPVIIGHRFLRNRMQTDKYVLVEYSESSIPEITFTDSLSLYFNGEMIRIIAIPGSHTDNDIMVHFTKSGYAYLGDIAYGLHIPSVDARSGDDSKYGEVVKKALDLLPNDTRFVSGHGRDLTMAEMREFQKILEETIEVIHSEMEKGKSVEEMQKEKILSSWEKYVKPEYTSANAWISNVVNGFNNVRMGPTPIALYYHGYQNGGIDSVINIYNDLKLNHLDEYEFHQFQFYKLAYFLLDKKKYDDAIKILEFDLSEYPDSYYLYDGLGEVYWKKGDPENSIKFYEKSLEIEPANTNATYMINLIKKSE